MNKLLSAFGLLALGFSVMLTSCQGGQAGKSDLKGSIRIDGSSTVYPVTEAVAEEFRAEAPDVAVTIGLSGTGGGFKKFARKETDISNASRPIKAAEADDAKQAGLEYIELEVAYDGLAVVVNPQNTWVDYLTVEELKKIWEPAAQETVTNWSQVRAGFPDQKLSLYGAGTASGTFDYFTEAIVGETASSRGDYMASEDDNVLVQGVSGDKGALGFFGLAYFTENAAKLKLVPVDSGSGPVAPTDETVMNDTYKPLSRPLYIYVSSEAAKRPEVVRFVEFYLENAGTLAPEVGYVALPSEEYQKQLEKFRQFVAQHAQKKIE